MTDEIEIAEQLPVEDAAVIDDDIQKPVFNQRQMQDVVKREQRKAFERGKREAMMELEQQQQQAQQVQQPTEQPQNIGGIAQLTQEDISRMIAEQAPQALSRHVQEMQHSNLVNSFVSKMQAAEQKYPGLEADLNSLNYEDPRLTSFIKLANELENTGDIMKEVLDNPTKLETLMNLSYNQPHLARKSLNALNDSIKVNQKAEQATQARDPMSKVNSSIGAGMADSQNLSVKDLQRILSQRR